MLFNHDLSTCTELSINQRVKFGLFLWHVSLIWYKAVRSLLANGSTAFILKAVLPLAKRLVIVSRRCGDPGCWIAWISPQGFFLQMALVLLIPWHQRALGYQYWYICIVVCLISVQILWTAEFVGNYATYHVIVPYNLLDPQHTTPVIGCHF